MQNWKNLMFILVIIITCNTFSSYAQEVIITTRPLAPRHERILAPSTRHIWIEEEWEPRGGKYVFVGGRWTEPPRQGLVWVAGHWVQRPRGEVWVPGHWRERGRPMRPRY